MNYCRRNYERLENLLKQKINYLYSLIKEIAKCIIKRIE